MKIFNKRAVLAYLAVVAAVITGQAVAAGYNIILKDAGSNILSCATGGFTFNKTTAGTFPTSGASVTLAANCLSPAILNGTYAPGALNVIVENVTLNKPGTGGQNEPLDQGPNVEGLSGTLQFTTTAAGFCDGTVNPGGGPAASKTYTITFSYAANSQNPAGRTYQITCSGPGSLSPINGRYHVVNTANPVPEPETLLLMLAGLGALSWTLRQGRR
jgi:PEP-CTERM motif